MERQIEGWMDRWKCAWNIPNQDHILGHKKKNLYKFKKIRKKLNNHFHITQGSKRKPQRKFKNILN